MSLTAVVEKDQSRKGISLLLRKQGELCGLKNKQKNKQTKTEIKLTFHFKTTRENVIIYVIKGAYVIYYGGSLEDF